MQPGNGNRECAVIVSLWPDILHALGLKPGAPLAAILDRRISILFPAEDAQAWGPVLRELPDGLVFVCEPPPGPNSTVECPCR
jgi:hypothetical protein